MRYIKPELGTKRIETWFALFPVTIGRETRWLEKVTVEQEYKEMANFCADVIVPSNEWLNVKFIND